jgi:hypothetical protein
MSHTGTTIDDRLAAWLAQQRLFFVATAPLSADGHINVSPKGLDTFRILDPQTVAYLDLTGSGIETVSHVKENGRIVIMFCAFEGPPKIVRIYGQGEVIEPSNAEFTALLALFPEQPGVRSILRIHVNRVADSCGFGVPLYEHRGERTLLGDWATKKGPEGIAEYQQTKNARSIDDLPGLQAATSAGGGHP